MSPPTEESPEETDLELDNDDELVPFEVNLDISCGHEVVFENSRLLKLSSKITPHVKTLALILKCWAKSRQINDSLMGTLSSYSYILLLVHYLQHVLVLPNLQPTNGVFTFNEVVHKNQVGFLGLNGIRNTQ